MSKKTRRRAPHGKSSHTKLSPEAVERKAREDLAGGRYREAIAGFKQLIKQEPRPAWRLALAEAYAGRARELATKDMLKEALVIWENRANLGDDITFDPEYAALLLRMGRVDSVLSLFLREQEVQPKERDRLKPLLAAAYLSGEDAVADRLPPNDPVVCHGQPARAALMAYCAHDDQALQNALAAIPYRSPYRDWVQILKALQRLPDAPREAAALLDRVGEHSAFYPLRRAAQLALLPETSFLKAITGERSQITRFACILRGWPQARIALREELDRLGTDARPDVLLRFMHRHRDSLGADWVRQRGLRLLIPGYPRSLKQFVAVGATRPSAEESLLLDAWAAEQREDLWDEHECWELYARHLIAEGSNEGCEIDHRLRVALALRRCDRLADVLTHADPDYDPEDLAGLVAGQLEESLTWDPDDRDTYLRLIGYYRRGKRPKDVRRLLEQAQHRWPKDMQVLEAAFDTALDAGSFKKATGLAREMLALDSINSGVRERLVQAHLAHARKQVVKGRADLARKELAAAGEWARNTHARDQLDLTSGLIALIEDAETGAPAVREIMGRLGGGLAGHLALALAGEALRLSPDKLLKAIGLDRPANAERDDLLSSLARLRTHLDSGGKITGELGAFLSKALAKATWANLSKSEAEAACETLRRCELHKARLSAARAALKRWKGEPLFELHAFEAKYPMGYSNCSERDIDRLDDALVRAREAGDTRTAMRIDEVLAALDPLPLGPVPFASPPPIGHTSSAPDVESLAMLIETLGLDKALSAMGLPAQMKRDLKKLEREHGREAVAETLGSFLEMFSAIADMDAIPPIPPPPKRKPAGPKRGQPKRRSVDDDAQDDDPFNQLELF